MTREEIHASQRALVIAALMLSPVKADRQFEAGRRVKTP